MEQGLAGLKVMVIDDSKTIRRTAETLLQNFDTLTHLSASHPRQSH